MKRTVKTSRQYDWLIVGSGLFGATFAYLARKRGLRCLVIDKRKHLGGNVYCENVGGITVHKYGAHIFHTSDTRLWKFVNRLVPFNRFTNSPMAIFGNKLYNLPFNMNTFHAIWGVKTPEEAMRIIDRQCQAAAAQIHASGRHAPQNLEEQALLLVGRDIYETLIKGYTEKQWGRACSQLPPNIIKRIPVRLSFDNNYFDDAFQGIPVGGYNVLIGKLLHGIETITDADFFTDRPSWESIAGHILYTGSIDQYFGYCNGHLSYRSLRFEQQTLEMPNFQGCAVVNYTSSAVPYTRIIEHKHFECFGQAVYDNPMTIISKEHPLEWHKGIEPFYPVNDDKNNKLHNMYMEMAQSCSNVVFGGRLADYRYYDMAPVMARAFDTFRAVQASAQP